MGAGLRAGTGNRTLGNTVVLRTLPIARIGEAEAQVVVAIARVVVVAISATHVPGVVVPGAAAIHAVGAAFRPEAFDAQYNPLPVQGHQNQNEYLVPKRASGLK